MYVCVCVGRVCVCVYLFISSVCVHACICVCAYLRAHVCMCVYCMSVYSITTEDRNLNTHRLPRTAQTSEDGTDVNFFFYALNHRQSEEGGVKQGLGVCPRTTVSDVFGRVFFFYTP